MDTLQRDFQVSFKTNGALYQQAKEVFTEKNLSMTEVMNEFLTTVVQYKEIPFVTEEDRKKAAIVADLEREINKSFESYEAGEYVTQSEMKARYGL